MAFYRTSHVQSAMAGLPITTFIVGKFTIVNGTKYATYSMTKAVPDGGGIYNATLFVE